MHHQYPQIANFKWLVFLKSSHLGAFKIGFDPVGKKHGEFDNSCYSLKFSCNLHRTLETVSYD